MAPTGRDAACEDPHADGGVRPSTTRGALPAPSLHDGRDPDPRRDHVLGRPHPRAVPGDLPHRLRRESGALGHRPVDARHLALVERFAHGAVPPDRAKEPPRGNPARAEPRPHQLHRVPVEVEHCAPTLRIVLRAPHQERRSRSPRMPRNRSLPLRVGDAKSAVPGPTFRSSPKTLDGNLWRALRRVCLPCHWRRCPTARVPYWLSLVATSI